MKKGSLFSKIAFTLITAVLIPFVVVFGLLFYTEWSTNELLNQRSNRVLTQFLFVVDKTMLEASDTARSLGNNRQCQTYSQYAVYQPEKAAYQTLVVKDELTERNNVKYYDIFVYYPKDDRVISSTNGSALADEYFAANYATKGYNREDFRNVLEMEMSRPHVFKMEGQEDYLCVGMRQTFRNNSERNFVVVLVIRPEYMAGLTLSNQQAGDGTLLIYDSKKSLVMGNSEQDTYSIDWYDGSNAHREIRSEAGDYTMHVQEFSSVDGYCAYALSTDIFRDTINSARLVLIAGLVVCLAVGVLVVFRGTKKVYTPIKNVVTEIKNEKLVESDSVSDEMELIKEAVSSNTADKHLLNRLNKETAVNQKKKAVYSLMQEAYTEAEAEQLLQSFDIQLISQHFAVCVIQVNSGGSIEKKQQEFVVQNVFGELAQQLGAGYFAQSGDNLYILLVNIRPEALETVGLSRWEEACWLLQEHYGAKVAVYFSQIHEGISEIPLALQEAQRAQKYSYLMGEARLIAYDSIKDRKFNYVSSVESKLSRMVIGYLKERTHSSTEAEFVDQIMQVYGIDAQSSMDTVECFKYEILSVLHKAAVSYSHAEQSGELLDAMMRSESLEEFQERLVAVLQMLVACKQDYSKTQDLCERIIAYIQSQYHDTELSVESIGRQVHMSPYYVSKLFKAEQGISVHAYIAKVRIDNAKKKLRQTDKSIAKIAEETGFLSSTVFIRTFKKTEGITPGVYRSIKE